MSLSQWIAAGRKVEKSRGYAADQSRLSHLSRYGDGPAADRNGWIYNTDVGCEDSEWRQRAFYGLKRVLAPLTFQSHTAANCLKEPKQRQNWLPAPKDGCHFTARFYGPYKPVIDGS